jgi:hypothetical protein
MSIKYNFLWLFPLFIFVLLPEVASANSCSSTGYTVFYINGILGTKNGDITDTHQLEEALPKQINNQSISVLAAPNPSALWGADDILKTLRQLQFWDDGQFHEDSDVDTILNQIYSELTTQKVLLVGHSQGAFYSNDVYYYLISHGLSKNSVAVYNVASPADRVAGGGTYETSFNDSIIKTIRQDVTDKPYVFGVKLPLPPNFIADISPDDPTGHLFVPSYLNAEPDTIVGDMRQTLASLKPTWSSDISGGCFTPPSQSLMHGTTIFVEDHALSTVEGVYLAGVGSAYGVANAVAWTRNLAASVYGGVAGMFGGSPQPNQKGEAAATFSLLSALNLTSLSGKDAQELLNQDQGAAAVLAVVPQESAAPGGTSTEAQGVVLGTTTEMLPALESAAPTSTEEVAPAQALAPSQEPAPGLVSHADGQGGSPPLAAQTPADQPPSPAPGDSPGAGPSDPDGSSPGDAAPDKTGPTIVSTMPAWGSVGVDPAAPLRIVYSEPLDAATIDTYSVSLAHILASGLRTWEPVAVSVSLEADQFTVDIVPLSALVPGESYSLGAGETVTDLAGNRAQALTGPVSNPQFRVAAAVEVQ